jgi:hypothetical protein
MLTQMDFYKSARASPMGKLTTDSFVPGSQATRLDFFRSNNLGKVSEHFMNSLMNNHPLQGHMSSQQVLASQKGDNLNSSVLCETKDHKMAQLRELMQRQHRNPTRNRQSVPVKDRKDWDLTKMAINSTGGKD